MGYGVPSKDRMARGRRPSGILYILRNLNYILLVLNYIMKAVLVLPRVTSGRIFSQPPLVSFKRDKNIGNFLVRSVLKSDDQPGTFKCARKRYNTCPFIHNADKITGPKRSIKITDRFTCTSANVTA